MRDLAEAGRTLYRVPTATLPRGPSTATFPRGPSTAAPPRGPTTAPPPRGPASAFFKEQEKTMTAAIKKIAITKTPLPDRIRTLLLAMNARPTPTTVNICSILVFIFTSLLAWLLSTEIRGVILLLMTCYGFASFFDISPRSISASLYPEYFSMIAFNVLTASSVSPF